MGIISSLIGGAFSLGSQGMANKAARKQQEREQAWNAEQAQINRDYQTSEREAVQAYNTGEREAAQAYNTSEREAVQSYNTGEREAAQAYNTSEREAAQQWNLEMWNKENEYNDPRAQMERMVAAGINPNAVASGIAGNGSMAGSIASSSGASSSGASSSPGGVSGASSSPGSGSAATTPSIAGFIGENIANSANSLWQNLAMQKEVKGKQLDNDMKQKELGVFDEDHYLSHEQIKASIAEMNKNVEDKDADIRLKDQQLSFLADMNPVQLKTANAMYSKVSGEVRQIDQQIENLKKQYNLTEEQIRNMQADTAKKDAETELIGAQQDLTESEKALTDLRSLYQEKENIVKGLESGAAEQGISFSAPDFWNMYNFEQKTGHNPVNTLMKASNRMERKRVWRNVGANLVQETGNALVNAGASWISNPLGMSRAFGNRGGNTTPDPKSFSGKNTTFTGEDGLVYILNR